MRQASGTPPSLKEKSLDGFLWAFVNKFGSIGFNFVVNIILARLLLPSDFGLIAMVLVFFELSNTFVNSGLVAAMIREKHLSEADKSTTFFFNLVTGILLYGLLFATSPWIAAFFDQPALVPILRVLGLNIVIGSFTSVQNTLLLKAIDFKTQAIGRVSSSFLAGIVAVLMACWGFGVWSLVAKMMLTTFAYTVFLWIVSPWRPLPLFSRASFRRLFGFGSHILGTQLLERFFRHFFQLVIGKFFSASTLGFYSQAANMRNLIFNSLFQTISQVTYPVLSTIQDEPNRLRRAYRKTIRLCSFFVVPALVLLGVLARPIIGFLLGENWLPAVPFLQLLCLAGLTQHINAINVNMLLVLGRSDLGLRLEILRKLSIVLAVIVGLQYGIYGLLWGEVVASLIGLLINTYYSKRFLNYALLDQLGDIALTLVLALALGIVVFLFNHLLGMPDLLQIIGGTLIGTALFFMGHWLTRSEEYFLLSQLLLPKARTFLRRLHQA